MASHESRGDQCSRSVQLALHRYRVQPASVFSVRKYPGCIFSVYIHIAAKAGMPKDQILRDEK
jgi:hypothetical protein